MKIKSLVQSEMARCIALGLTKVTELYEIMELCHEPLIFFSFPCKQFNTKPISSKISYITFSDLLLEIKNISLVPDNPISY